MPLSPDASKYAEELFRKSRASLSKERDSARNLMPQEEAERRVGYLGKLQPEIEFAVGLGKARAEALRYAYEWDGQPLTEEIVDGIVREAAGLLDHSSAAIFSAERGRMDLRARRTGAPVTGATEKLGALKRHLIRAIHEAKESIRNELRLAMFEAKKSHIVRSVSDHSSEVGAQEPLVQPNEPAKAIPRSGLSQKRWDVFISHASEDKEEIAKPLAEALRARGYEVWYDEFALKVGDSLREEINRGLAESRYGVVILSKHFFGKNWTNLELDGLTAIEVEGQSVILPVWHGVGHVEVAAYSPILAGKFALNTQIGLDKVVDKLEEKLNPPMIETIGYRCCYCGSPLSETGSVPLGEQDDGTFETFACGYSTIDGFIQYPCPSDPRFPQIEDYEFQYREVTGDPLWKWKCFAVGKTKLAQMVALPRGLGRTKEEARQQVVQHYNTCAEPWKK